MDLGNGEVGVRDDTSGFGMGSQSDQLFDVDDWNYDTDLNILRNNLRKTITRSEKLKVRDLIVTSIRLTQNALKEAQARKTETETVSGELKETNGVVQRSGINPLEMDLILKMTLGYLPVNELLTCRVVNKSWNCRAVSWIRKKQTSHIVVAPDDFPRFCADFEKTITFPLPLSKIRLELEGLSSEKLTEFFTKHGSSIEDLVVEEIGEDKDFVDERLNPSSDQKLKKLQQILKHVPNMKQVTLTLDIIPEIVPGFIFDQTQQQGFTLPKVEKLTLSSKSSLRKEFLDGLFAILPNVQVVDLGLFNEDQDWEAFASAMQPRSVHTIHSLSLVETAAIWTAFQGTQRLKELSLKLEIYPSDDFSLVDAQHEYLKSQSESLEVLTLINGDYNLLNREMNFDSPKLHLPVMTNLKSLSLLLVDDDSKSTDTPFRLVRIEQEQVPNLKSLTIDYLLFNSALGRSAVFPSVQELEFKGNHEYWFGIPERLNEILAKFPNLRKLSELTFALTARDMQYLVSSGLKFFDELELVFTEVRGAEMKNVNLVLSGIPVDSAWLLSQMEDRVGRDAVLSWIDPPGPSLRDLKGLKRLVLKFEPRYRRYSKMDVAVIDEIGVNMTFLRLPRELNLTLKGDFSISEELAAKMTAHFQHICFSPTPPSEKHSEL